MANSDNPGYKVEKLTRQQSAFTSRGYPARTLLEKEGTSNLSFRGIERKPLMYLKDLYITLVDLKWRYVLLILLSTYLLSYLGFAVVYWLVCYMHGQFGSRGREAGYTPCIERLDSFASAFLFSMETQSTIGFGSINPNAECPGVVPAIYFQITVGFMVETFVLGFLFVKVARPKNRRHTLVFSRNACLCLEDGSYQFQIRVGDLRRTHLVDATVHGVLVRRRVVPEQHVYPLFQHRMAFTSHGMEDKVFLIWPLILSHRISADSPLWALRQEDVYRDKVDIIIILEGTIESTGELCQARTCYSARDILWGHRFVRVEEFDEIDNMWCVDFTRFNNVLPSPTPRTSAREFHEPKEPGTETTEGEGDPLAAIYDNASCTSSNASMLD